MGNYCCSPQSQLNEHSPKIFRLINKNPIEPQDKSSQERLTVSASNKSMGLSKSTPASSERLTYNPAIPSRKTSSQTKISSKNNLYFQIYDLEQECGGEYLLSQSINLTGLSQISIDNKLFLCGSNYDNNSGFNSSYLYTLDTQKEPLELSFGVNLFHSHYYPTLTSLHKEYLVVLGGKGTVKCEFYSINSQFWQELPELPEERYKATAIFDEIHNFIYIFGGFNFELNKCMDNILRLNVKACLNWETLNIEEKQLIGRMNSGIVKKEQAVVYICGGDNGKGEYYDNIISIDLKASSIKPEAVEFYKFNNKKVMFNFCRVGESNNKGQFFLFDDSNDKMDKIFKIGDCNILSVSLYD